MFIDSIKPAVGFIQQGSNAVDVSGCGGCVKRRLMPSGFGDHCDRNRLRISMMVTTVD
jgi:hypothetical protein